LDGFLRRKFSLLRRFFLGRHGSRLALNSLAQLAPSRSIVDNVLPSAMRASATLTVQTQDLSGLDVPTARRAIVPQLGRNNDFTAHNERIAV
jgi:hypothetical protein